MVYIFALVSIKFVLSFLESWEDRSTTKTQGGQIMWESYYVDRKKINSEKLTENNVPSLFCRF